MSNHSLRIFAFVQSIRFSSIPLLASLYEARTLVTITVVFSRGVTGVFCSFGVIETSVDELFGLRRAIKPVFQRLKQLFLHLSVISVRIKHSFIACLF